MILKSNHPLLLFGLIVMVLACAPTSLQAQVDDKEKADQEAAKRKELEKNSLRLLDEAIGGVGNIKLRENRSYILATAADVLWPYDEKRARTLFWEALGSLKLPTDLEAKLRDAKNANSKKPTSPEFSEALMEYSDAFQMRRALLKKVALRDAQLALDMMRSTRQSAPPQVPGPRFDIDAGQEQELTYAAAANDPDRVLRLARETMAQGLKYEFLNSLEQVNQRNPDAGTQLSGEIIAKLKTENLAANSDAAHIAARLLYFSRPKGITILTTTYDPPATVFLKLDDHQRQELVDMLITGALNTNAGAGVLYSIQLVMPEISKYAPDRVAKVKARAGEYNRTLPLYQRDRNTFSLRFERATPEEMINALPAVADAQRGALFYQAAAKAVARGEADRYRELLNSQIKDESERKRALDDLNNQQLDYDIRNGKSDDLEKLIPLIRMKSLRVSAMSHRALLLEKKDQHDKAVKLLDEARTLANLSRANKEQATGSQSVMLGYAVIEPTKAFAIIEPVIDRSNDETSKLMILDWAVAADNLKDGELILHQSQNPLDYSMAKYSEGVVSLAKADFDRTKGLAERFQRNELKIVARLLMAQVLLRYLEQASNK